MTTELDLTALRDIAKEATQSAWAFTVDSDDDPYGEWPQSLVGPKNQQASERAIANGFGNDVDEINELSFPDITHIAAFDPPTALALIDRLEAAEAKVAAVREVHKPVPVYTTEAGDCEHGGDCEAVEISAGSYCPVHTDGLTCNACADLAEHADDLPAYPCPTTRALDATP